MATIRRFCFYLIIFIIVTIHYCCSIVHFSYLDDEEFFTNAAEQRSNLSSNGVWFGAADGHYGLSFGLSDPIYYHWSYFSKPQLKTLYYLKLKPTDFTFCDAGNFILPDGSNARIYLVRSTLEEWLQEFKNNPNLIGYGRLSYLYTKDGEQNSNNSDIVTVYKNGECQIQMFCRQSELRQLIAFGRRDSHGEVTLRDHFVLPDGRATSITARPEFLESLLNGDERPVYITQTLKFNSDAAKQRHSAIGRSIEAAICWITQVSRANSTTFAIIMLHFSALFLIIGILAILKRTMIALLSNFIMACSSIWHECIVPIFKK